MTSGNGPTCDDVRDRLALPEPGDDAAVAAHLLSCAACREEGAALRRAAAVLRAAHALEASRSRRAPLFATVPRRRRTGRGVALAAALAAALALVAWLALRDTAPPPIEWSGNGAATRLSATEVRLDSGSVRFEARAAFVVRTRVATFTGDVPATFRVTLESETDPMTTSSPRRPAVAAALGGGALLSAVLFVESGSVRVATEPEKLPSRVVAAGETFRARPPSRPSEEPAATAPRPKKTVPKPAAAEAENPAPAADPGPSRGSCHGRLVFEDDGSPVAHETVWLWGTPRVVAKTDANGRFRIENDWVDSMPRALLVGPEDAGVFAGPVPLVAGKDVEVAFTVERGFVLEVTVAADESGIPLSGVWVYLDRDPYADRGSCAGLTGPGGRVEFRHVPRRRFGLRAAKDGWTAAPRALEFRGAGPRESLRVEMSKADPFTLVVEDWPEGREAPVAVHFSGVGEAGISRFGTIDRRGVFVSTAPPAGRYDVVLVEAESWRESIGPVEVEPRTPLELRVKRPGGSRVAGHVAGTASMLAGPGRITLVSVADGSVTREGEIHAGGRFSVDLVPAGRYEVAIEFGDTVNLLGCLDDLDVPEGGLDDCRIALPDGRISGRVRGGPGDAILVDFHAAALRDGKDATILARTERDGRFDVRTLPFGRWRVSVAASESGYSEPVEVDVPGAGPVELVWREFPETAFLLRTASGAPVARTVGVNALSENVHPASRFATLDPDASGRCAARVLPPGEWRIVLAGDGREIGRCVVHEGENGPFELVLPD